MTWVWIFFFFWFALGDTDETGVAGAEYLDDAGDLGAVAFVDEDGAEFLGDARDPGAVAFVDEAGVKSWVILKLSLLLMMLLVLWMMLEQVLVDLREVFCPLSFSVVLFPSRPVVWFLGWTRFLSFCFLGWLTRIGCSQGLVFLRTEFYNVIELFAIPAVWSSALCYYHHLPIPAYYCLKDSLKTLPCQSDPEYIISKGGTGGRS